MYISIPSLGMVDDVMVIQKCSSDSVRMNAVVNAFVEAKKLTLNKTKCHKLHIQNKRNHDRKNKGYGMVAEIINEIPLGQFKMEIGLKLRQAMLLNGLLFNSEAWHDINDVEIKLLESVDERLLRSLVGGHAKTPLEFLYLEAGAIPIRFILSCRRLIYLQTLIKRPEDELTKRVYMKQKESPSKGDYFNLVKDDFKLIGETMDEREIANKSKDSHKRNI